MEALSRFLPDKTEEEIGHVSYSARLAEEKKKAKDYRMPIFQNAGFIDAQIGKWPLDPENDDIAAKTLRYWMDYDHISTEGFYDAASPTGLSAAETFMRMKTSVTCISAGWMTAAAPCWSLWWQPVCPMP